MDKVQLRIMTSIINRIIELAGWIVLGVSVILLGVASHIDNYQPPEPVTVAQPKEGANKQVISSQADSLIKISRIWADFFPANTSNQPI